VLVAATGVLAGCGGSSGTPSNTPTPTHTAASPSGSSGGGTSASGAKGQIIANWTAFFGPKTPTAERIKLLQNGQLFAPVIKAQAKSPLAQGASAKVLAVVVTSPTMATVAYNIVFGGQVALRNQQGQAVKESGIWKVGDSSFCGLLTLENNGKTTGLPAPCKALGT
jgi:hypothetical protein